jgi:hypothetical protein
MGASRTVHSENCVGMFMLGQCELELESEFRYFWAGPYDIGGAILRSEMYRHAFKSFHIIHVLNFVNLALHLTWPAWSNFIFRT